MVPNTRGYALVGLISLLDRDHGSDPICGAEPEHIRRLPRRQRYLTGPGIGGARLAAIARLLRGDLAAVFGARASHSRAPTVSGEFPLLDLAANIPYLARDFMTGTIGKLAPLYSSRGSFACSRVSGLQLLRERGGKWRGRVRKDSG